MDASSKNDIVRDQVVTIVNRKASTFFSTQTTARRVTSIPLGVAIVITSRALIKIPATCARRVRSQAILA
jgi:hypothetical protein